MLALQMKEVTKRFRQVVANDRITFEVRSGTIHGLVGENGAGKSTLMNLLYGLIAPDTGEILVHGSPVRFSGPGDAIAAGIGMVHQHFMLVGPLTVTENIVLGCEPASGPFLDHRKAREAVVDLSRRFGLAVNPDERVGRLSVGLAQRVEILKTLYRGARILILDEPTAVLTPQEVKEFLKILAALRQDGVTIVFISHKLKEIKEITDELTVIRSGKVIGAARTGEVSEREIARMMVGREVSFTVTKDPPRLLGKGMTVQGLEALNNKGLPALRGVSFEVNRGEILGIAGIEGNGQTELVEVLTGLRPPTGGRISFTPSAGGDLDLTAKTPRQLADAGLSHVPEDRHRRGLQVKLSVGENLVTNLIDRRPFSRLGVIDEKAIEANAGEKIREFDIRCSSSRQLAQNLSGGNQQKIVIAREFTRNPEVIIISQPTRGVDIGAIEFIHHKIIELRDAGVAILLVSAELSEIMNLSDRIGVIFEGEIVRTMPAANATEEQLGLLMAGIISETGVPHHA